MATLGSSNLKDVCTPGNLHKTMKEKSKKDQIDYITINIRFRVRILNVKTYPGCNITPDPKPVVTTMMINLQKVKRITASDYKNKQELYEKLFDILLNRNKTITDRNEISSDKIEQTSKTFRDTVVVAGIQENGAERRK